MKIDLTDALQCSTSVQVAAHWDAIADSAFNLHNASPIHVELFNFSPSHPIKEYGIDAFKVFLPSSAVEVGDVWQLDSHGVVPFLHQFHSRAQRQHYITARKVLTRVSARSRHITRR